MLMLPLIMFDC